MSWIKINADDVLPPQAERLAIVAAKGTDDLPDIVDEITEAVRQAYRDGGRPLGPDGTIPSGLKHHASALCIWHFVSAGVTKNENIQTPARRQAAEEAQKYLDAIGRREIKIGGAQIVSGNPRMAERKRLNGL